MATINYAKQPTEFVYGDDFDFFGNVFKHLSEYEKNRNLVCFYLILFEDEHKTEKCHRFNMHLAIREPPIWRYMNQQIGELAWAGITSFFVIN